MARKKKQEGLGNLQKLKGIARIDQEDKRTHGWYVRVLFKGEMHCKFFSDRKQGGPHAARLAALAWRNDTEVALGKIRTDKHYVTTTNNNTGVIGVRLNNTLQRYEVSWVNADGSQGKTSTSIKRHGKDMAFAKACQIRKEREAARLAGGR